MSASLMQSDYEQAIREFIDFVNAQVGAYGDACSGFSKNKSIVKRQVQRILVRSGNKIGDDGIPVMMHTAIEDPTQPEVVMHRIVLAAEYLSANSEGGANEQQHARAAIVFVYAFWDEEIRPRLARARGVGAREIGSDIFGDLRHLRHAILHNKGKLTDLAYSKLKVLQDAFAPNAVVSLPNATIHRIFFLVKKEVAQMLLRDTGAAATAPFDVSDIVEIAIQRL
jgi:hypothetical protein